MNQYQYDTIIKLIANGAPALAEELCNAFADVITERNRLRIELDELKKTDEEKT